MNIYTCPEYRALQPGYKDCSSDADDLKKNILINSI